MYEPYKAEEAVRETILLVLMLIILFGNALILVAFLKSPRLRTGSNVFIAGLAASDWLVAALAIPLYLVTLKSDSPTSLLMRFYISLDIFSATASVFHLISVTVERYIAVVKPYLHHALLVESYCRVLGVVWVLSLILSCLNFVITPNVDKNYPFYVFVTALSLALLIIPSLNFFIFIVARTIIRNTIEPEQEQTRTNRVRSFSKYLRERKTAATLAIICGTFFLMWLPHVIGVFVFKFCFSCNLAPVDIGRVVFFIKFAQYANSALNPFVFAFRDAGIRRTIKSFLASSWFNVMEPLRRISSTRETTSQQ
ncbi:adenosine receptor A2a-like [Montipora foliosa]|uniref:adenosine receptor A2a-like n=1 Tax=Montipora foliosa TaxID=591990 RepID=UPI0035F15129